MSEKLLNFEVSKVFLDFSAFYNKKIEKDIKFQLMGIQDKPLMKIGYSIKGLLKGKSNENAEDLIRNQMQRVNKISEDLGRASLCIDNKILAMCSQTKPY